MGGKISLPWTTIPSTLGSPLMNYADSLRPTKAHHQTWFLLGRLVPIVHRGNYSHLSTNNGANRCQTHIKPSSTWVVLLQGVCRYGYRAAYNSTLPTNRPPWQQSESITGPPNYSTC